jgi:MFS transporter, DHA1 family, multidrug resistance protein
VTQAPQPDPAIGQLVIATRVISGGPTSARSRSVLVLLAVSVGLMMIGYGIAMPVFAKRLAEFGSGVAALGFMTMGFAAAQFFLSPVMGSLADRIGRRPLVLVALAGMVVANIGYLLAASTAGYIALRVFQGAVTAGLLPAAIAIVGDSVPERRRAQGTGMMMGAYGAGFVSGR